jgi:hypothetical protein
MNLPRTRTGVLQAATGGLTVPRLAKVGAMVIALGLGVDLAVHTVLHSIHDELLGAFPLQEHAAHMVVIVGMVLVLAGIVAGGVRSTRRPARQEGTSPHAPR